MPCKAHCNYLALGTPVLLELHFGAILHRETDKIKKHKNTRNMTLNRPWKWHLFIVWVLKHKCRALLYWTVIGSVHIGQHKVFTALPKSVNDWKLLEYGILMSWWICKYEISNENQLYMNHMHTHILWYTYICSLCCTYSIEFIWNLLSLYNVKNRWHELFIRKIALVEVVI